MKRRIRAKFLALLLSTMFVLALAGCATDAPASEPSPPATDHGTVESEAPMAPASDATHGPESQAPAPSEAATIGEAGSFTVDGTLGAAEYAVTDLNRCVPFSEGDGNLDLQALAPGAQLNLVLLGGTTEVSVQGPVIGSQTGSIAYGSSGGSIGESTVSGGRWTGSATLADSLGSVLSVDVTWDVMIPSDVNDCSL